MRTALAYFACGCLFYSTGVYALISTDRAVPLGWRVAVLGLGCVTLLWRSSRPLLALGVGLAVTAVDARLGGSIPVLLVAGDLLYCATLYTSRRINRILVGLVAATALITMGIVAVVVRDWRVALVYSTQIALFMLVPVWWAMTVRQQREAAEAERARSAQLARIAELDRRAAVVGERARMARDLHDAIAGNLSAIAIQSEAVLSLADGDPATVRTVLQSVRDNSVRSLAEMRAMIGLLRADTDPADPHTAPPRLRDLDALVESARAGGLTVVARNDFGELDLPAAVDLAAYRIVQEALTNAVKYAPGACASVDVREVAGRIVVTVTNERTETIAADGLGTGLWSMRERAELVGGTVAAGPDDVGWTVRAELPTRGAEL
ncbi:two-component sensor histidine kinase [Solihabitans fulvus]|uniref:histidine kinase n=1 Tax=Solihabitans fulvus TaxID=1892852 RepID=A0A5B2WRY8_9PSEU|nr:two-component sensor histidine kinase [Solihabitans fulvus]